MSDRLTELMRNRLIELVLECCTYTPEYSDQVRLHAEYLAQHLLNAGVIVAPCKVGDTVYCHDNTLWADECGKCEYFQVGGMGDPHECSRTESLFKHPDCTKIVEVVATQQDIYRWLAYGNFGQTVFFTREEAEKALIERGENGKY